MASSDKFVAPEPHQPPYTYTANQGYQQTEAVPPSIANTAPPQNIDAIDENDDDDDLDDVFNSADELEDEDFAGGADLTKSYNRQRQLHGDGIAAPRSN